MRRIFETCVPREEILKGELPEEAFAARLADVISGRAHPVYGDPVRFFARTHPTASLKEVLHLALGRLSGRDPSANSILRLETGFGGGKTHSLIALYHSVSGVEPKLLAPLVEQERVPRERLRVVALVGTDMDPADGVRKPDGTVTRTLWGELAHQARGAEGYACVAGSDAARTAPSSVNLDAALGPAPCLVLIDELAQYLRVAREHRLQVGTLDQQVPPFLHSLFELAASRPNVVVVLTLASTADAYAEETELLLGCLKDISSVLGRFEQILRPVGSEDLAPVLRRRLFEQVDEGAAAETAQAFQEWYATLMDRSEALPEFAAKAEYRGALANCYPFHPDLLNLLENKVATLPNFQRTRGALRLLGLMIRRLWETRPADCHLIQPGHVDLSYEPVASDLTTRLGLNLKAAIGADVANQRLGDPGHAQAMDEAARKTGRVPVVTRVAQSIFLHSLSQGTPGCDRNELNLAVVQPGLEPMTVERAAQDLLDRAWHLHHEGQRYRFKETPSLTKIIASEVNHVTKAEAKQKLQERIYAVYKEGSFLQSVLFPEQPEDMPDDDSRPHLGIIHFDSASSEAGQEQVPPLVARLFDTRNAAGDFRRFQNHALFLVANAADVGSLVETARRYEAIKNLYEDQERWRDLPPEQREELKSRRERSELDLRVAITAAYRHLYFPMAGSRERRLQRLTLPTPDAAQVKRKQQEVLVEALQGAKKLLMPDDKPLVAAFVLSKVWPGQQEEMSVADFKQAFARQRDLPIHTSPELLRATITEGIRSGVWGYHDGARVYVKVDGEAGPVVPMAQFTSTHRLLTLDAARRLWKDEQKKKKPADPVKKGTGGGPMPPPDGGGGVLLLRPSELQGSGEPKRAFQEVFDAAAALEPPTRTARLSLQVRVPEDLAKLALAVSQWPNCTVQVGLRVEAEVGPGGEASLGFRGPWDRYRALLKVPAEELVRQARKGEGLIDAEASFTVELPDAEAVEASSPLQAGIQRSLVDLQVGSVTVTVHLLEEPGR